MASGEPGARTLRYCPLVNAELVALREVLTRLAAPAAEQATYLDRLGVAPLADELALELQDAASRIPELVEAGHLSARQAELVRFVDGKLAAMSDEPNLWTIEALARRPEWADVRRLAADAAREPNPIA